MKPIDPQEWKQDLPAFREKTAAFYKGELKKNDYKGFSGLYGSYAQKDGKASMAKADCPDKICVNHAAISKKGETIVCLPHKVVVEVVDENGIQDGNQIDIISK